MQTLTTQPKGRSPKSLSRTNFWFIHRTNLLWGHCCTCLKSYTTEATFVHAYGCKIFETHLNPVMLVFIGKLLLSTLRWVPMCQGFRHISSFFASFCNGQISHQHHRYLVLYRVLVIIPTLGRGGEPLFLLLSDYMVIYDYRTNVRMSYLHACNPGFLIIHA